jgi:hypothetical protein
MQAVHADQQDVLDLPGLCMNGCDEAREYAKDKYALE